MYNRKYHCEQQPRNGCTSDYFRHEGHYQQHLTPSHTNHYCVSVNSGDDVAENVINNFWSSGPATIECSHPFGDPIEPHHHFYHRELPQSYRHLNGSYYHHHHHLHQIHHQNPHTISVPPPNRSLFQHHNHHRHQQHHCSYGQNQNPHQGHHYHRPAETITEQNQLIAGNVNELSAPSSENVLSLSSPSYDLCPPSR